MTTSPEVISACENVCRDFSWVFLSDPRILQGICTLLAAGIAGGIALYIAIKVYPKQKEVDRQHQIKLEQRKAYEELVQLLHDMGQEFARSKFTDPVTASETIESILQGIKAFESKIVQKSIMLPTPIVESAQSSSEAIRSFMETVKDNLLDTLRKSDEIDAVDFEALFDSEKEKTLKVLDDTTSVFINEVRSTAYEGAALEGEVKITSRWSPKATISNNTSSS